MCDGGPIAAKRELRVGEEIGDALDWLDGDPVAMGALRCFRRCLRLEQPAHERVNDVAVRFALVLVLPAWIAPFVVGDPDLFRPFEDVVPAIAVVPDDKAVPRGEEDILPLRSDEIAPCADRSGQLPGSDGVLGGGG